MHLQLSQPVDKLLDLLKPLFCNSDKISWGPMCSILERKADCS